MATDENKVIINLRNYGKCKFTVLPKILFNFFLSWRRKKFCAGKEKLEM